MGMICASNGWSVEASACAAILAPRRLRCRALARRRRVVRGEGIVVRCIYYSIDADQTHGARSVLGVPGVEWGHSQSEAAAHIAGPPRAAVPTCVIRLAAAVRGRPSVADLTALLPILFSRAP